MSRQFFIYFFAVENLGQREEPETAIRRHTLLCIDCRIKTANSTYLLYLSDLSARLLSMSLCSSVESEARAWPRKALNRMPDNIFYRARAEAMRGNCSHEHISSAELTLFDCLAIWSDMFISFGLLVTSLKSRQAV